MIKNCNKKIEIFIPQEWKQKLNTKATEQGCATINETVRCAIREYIKENQKE